MIASGASVKAVQTVLGHGSAAFTLTPYGHMFDADLDDLADRIDGLSRTERRPNDLEGFARAAETRSDVG
jgi:hypothetical protein